MQQYCTRCGSPRSAPAAPCVTCGTRPPDPPGPGELTRADGSIPVYVEPDPTTWDYEPLGPDGGVPGATGGGPPPWGYYDEPQQLPAAGGFWGTFPGSPGAPPRARQRRAVRARPASRGPRRRSRWQRAPWRGPGGRLPATLVAAAVLLLVAFGGGAYAAITAFTGHPGKPGQAGPSALAIGASASPAAQSSALPPTGAPPPASPAASPSATAPGTTVTPPAPDGAIPVAVTARARADGAEPAVLAFVRSYFGAINAHDYQAYARLLDPGQAATETRARFDDGYSSTIDSAATLAGISAFGDRGEAAAITFTSQQDPAQSVTGTDSCDHWAITLYLEPGGSGDVLGTAPAGYRARHQAC